MARGFGVVLIILSLVLPAGCSPGGDRYRGHSHTVISQPDTIARSWSLVVDESTMPPRVRVNMRLTEGTLRWALTGPDGEIQWEHEIAGPKTYRTTLEFEPLPGLWEFQFVCVGAGDFLVEWMGFAALR